VGGGAGARSRRGGCGGVAIGLEVARGARTREVPDVVRAHAPIEAWSRGTLVDLLGAGWPLVTHRAGAEVAVGAGVSAGPAHTGLRDAVVDVGAAIFAGPARITLTRVGQEARVGAAPMLARCWGAVV